MSDAVHRTSPGRSIAYRDTRDHFENGVLRLLGLNAGEFDAWLAAAEGCGAADLLGALAAGFALVRPSVDGGPVGGPVERGPHGERGRLWHAAIAESPTHGFATDPSSTVAWLVRRESGGFRRETTPPTYEESYFEDDKPGTGGYGGYADQAPWRMQKARRQVAELDTGAGVRGGHALDVGCGYGYFRAALADAGYTHEGVEVSAHARRVAASLFGFATLDGLLEDQLERLRQRFDLLTMWDVIEHVPQPVELLAAARECLRPGGVIAMKTPSIACPEAEIFGPHYHSLKREHLVLLGPTSVAVAAAAADLEVIRVTTVSHLLRGFVGQEALRWAENGRGADLIAYLRAP